MLFHRWPIDRSTIHRPSISGPNRRGARCADDIASRRRLRPTGESSQQRRLLVLVAIHSAKNVIECSDRLTDVGSLVQHHALCSAGHKRIRNLSSRWPTCACQLVENLRRPDRRNMARLTEPQNLLLHLGETFESALDGEVAARHHDADPLRCHRRQEHLRQSIESADRLDFQYNAEPGAADRLEVALQCGYVVGTLCEGKTYQVSALYNDGQ